MIPPSNTTFSLRHLVTAKCLDEDESSSSKLVGLAPHRWMRGFPAKTGEEAASTHNSPPVVERLLPSRFKYGRKRSASTSYHVSRQYEEIR
jgi:hypothetical protein